MVDKIQGGLLIDDGGYWGGASRRQKKQQESLAGHYNGLYSQTTRPQERRDYASALWSLIVDDKAGAINTDIFYGVLAGVDLMNLEKISEFQKVLEQSHAIQDHVLSTIFGFADTEATERRKKSIPTYFQQTGEDVDAESLVAISSVDAAQLEYITATIKEATKSLSSLFQNHIFALNLFQKCPKFIARCSDEVLLGYALNNSGAAYCIFADPKLRAKVLPKLKAIHIPMLIASIPSQAESFGRNFFDSFFVNALSDTKGLIGTGLLKTAATVQVAPDTFSETSEGKREETKWKAIERIRSYFYRAEYKSDAVDYPLGAYLQQHPEVVVELCGGKEALDLTRLKQLINLHSDSVEFVITLAQSQFSQELQEFIIKNLYEIFAHVKDNIQKEERSSNLFLADKYKRIDTFLQKNPAMILQHCGGADHFELDKLLKLTDLCQDPVEFLKSLAKNPTTRDLVTNNIGDIVLHLQKKMEDAGVEHSSIQNKINALLKCGITGDCVYVPSSGNQLALSKTLRGHLYKEVLSLSAEDRTRKAEDLGKEDVQKKRDKYLSLFCNDHLRGQLNFGKNRYDRDAWVLRNILDVSEDHTPDQTLCFTIASDNSLWNRVKGIYTEADLKGKSVYFQARIALDNGSITHANFAALNPGLKTAVSALVAARPKLFWPKIKKPDYGLWARFWHTVSKGSFYRSAHEKYRGFSRFVSENSLLSGKFAITETGLGKRSNFELRKEEDDSSVTFSKYLVAQVQADYSLLSNDSGNVFKQVICEGASPKELLDVLANDSSGKLILYVVQNKKYLNKLLRNTTEDLQALPGKLSPLSAVLHYFSADGSCIVVGADDQLTKSSALQVALIGRIPELIADVKVFYADLFKIYDIATKTGSQNLLLALLRNSIAKSVALFKQDPKEVKKEFIQKLLLSVLTNAAQLNQGETQAVFGDFIKYFIDNDSWLTPSFFANVSAEVLYKVLEEIQKSDTGLLGKLLDKLNTHKQVSKIAAIVGRLTYEVIVGNKEVITKVLTPDILASFSLGSLLHFFNDKGEFFVGTNGELQKQVGTKILEKISDAAPYEEFSKLFILKLSGDATFAQQICAKFADNWTEILSATTSEEKRTKQRQFTKELLLEDSERGKIFRQKVSAVVLLNLNASKIIEAQDWTKIIAALWKESNRQVLISLWQQQSDLVKYFAFGEWAKLDDGVAFKQFVANPTLTLQNLLSLFNDVGQARRELETALNIVVGSIGERVKVGAAATISLADIDKCSKLPGMDLAVLVDFYIKNWEAYNAQIGADNVALTARWLAADNACGKQFRQKFSVELLQKIAPEQLAASINLLWQDNPVLVVGYLSKLDFTGLQKNSAVIGGLINKTDYLAKVEKFDDVLQFFNTDGHFYCDDVAGKQKVVDRLLQLLPSQFATITAEQVRKLSAIHDEKISQQLEQWATKSWDVFAGLPVDLRLTIINKGVHRGSSFAIQFLDGHFDSFVSLVKTDVAFAKELSSEAYSGLLLAAINNKKEASPVIELIKQYGKYEALILLLNKQGLQFVQQKENFGFFTPLCDGEGLVALEKSVVDAADLLKFFDGAGKIIPEFAAILTRPRIVAQIISTGNFLLQGTEVLAAAKKKPSDVASSSTVIDQQKARELARSEREKAAAAELARYQEELGKRAADVEIKIKRLGEELERTRKVEGQNIVKIQGLEQSLLEAKREKSDIAMAKKAADERQLEKKAGGNFSGTMSVIAKQLKLPVGASASSAQGEPKPVKIKIAPSSAIKAQLDFAQIKAIISLAIENIAGLELAIAHLLGVLPKCKEGVEAKECQALLKSLLDKNNLVIPSIIAALRTIDVSDQLKHIRILDGYLAEFFKSLQPASISLPRKTVVDVLKYFLQFEFNPKAKGGLPQGQVVKEINEFFAQHPEYYDYVITDAKDDELLSMMQKNPSVFVQAVNSQKLSAGALIKLFSRFGVLEAKNAQDLISAIADQYGAGLSLFAYLAALEPEARRALTKYETGFVKRWWEKNQAEFIAKISEVQAPVLRAMLNYRIEDIDIAGAVFVSADGMKKCIDCLSSAELKQYEKLIVSMMPQAVVTVQKKQEDVASDQKQPKPQFSSQAEEMEAKLRARGGAQMGETGAAKSNVVVTPAERKKFIEGLNVELVKKLLQMGSAQINQKLCCVEVGVLLLVLSCGELGKTVVNQQKAGVTALLAKPGINLVGFNQQHWAILIEAGVQIPLSVYQHNRKLIGEFLFGKDSSELLKISALKACPVFFVVDAKKSTIGEFDIGKFSDTQLKVLLQSLVKEQQTFLVDILLARKPQLIADLFNELSSDDIARQWNVFKVWLSQQLSGEKLTKEQAEKLLACKNPEVKQWLGGVFERQPALVEDIFKAQQSIVGNEKFFLPYLQSLFVDYSGVMIDLSSGSMDLTAEKISAEDIRKCLGSQDGEMQTWLGNTYAQAPKAVTALLNALDADAVQQNYCIFKPVILTATTILSANLAKFFDASGACIEAAKEDIEKLFRAKPETLVELIKYKYSDTDFIKGFVQNNFALLQDLLPQFTDTTVVRAILEHGNPELWTKLFSNEELFKIAMSSEVISALKDQHYTVILSDKAIRAMLKVPAFGSIATACSSMLATWCNTVTALDQTQKQIIQNCFKDEQVRDLFFNIDRITVSQVAALAKIGDEFIVNVLLDNVDRKIIGAFFAATNGKQLQSIADENPAFAKVVFERGITKPDIFKATFVTGRSSEYRQKQFNQWLALAVDNKDIKALNILLAVQEGAFLVNAYNELPQARKVALMEFSPSFISAIASQEQKVAQPMLGGSTSAAMSKFAAMDYVDISAVLKVKDEGEWARLSANAEFVKSLQREFNALIKRETYDTQALSRLALFLSNRFACVGLEPYLLLRAIAAVANNGKDVVWQDVKLTIKHFDEKLAGSNPEAKSFVTYATHIVTEKLKLLDQQQVQSDVVAKIV